MAPRLRLVGAVVRLKPDAVVINDTDDRNRNIEKSRGNCRDAVKAAVRWGIKNIVPPEGLEPLRLILRN